MLTRGRELSPEEHRIAAPSHHPYLLSHCPSCFLWAPLQSGEGEGREGFLTAPGGPAPRPGALNSSRLCQAHTDSAHRQRASLPLGSEGLMSAPTAPVGSEQAPRGKAHKTCATLQSTGGKSWPLGAEPFLPLPFPQRGHLCRPWLPWLEVFPLTPGLSGDKTPALSTLPCSHLPGLSPALLQNWAPLQGSQL